MRSVLASAALLLLTLPATAQPPAGWNPPLAPAVFPRVKAVSVSSAADVVPAGMVSAPGNCSTCGTGATGIAGGNGSGYPGSGTAYASAPAAHPHPFKIGDGCASNPGCTNLAAERTFLFGSCRQFFTPGNQCGRGGCGSSLFGGRGAHEPLLLGSSNLGTPNPCVYGSYLNR